MTFSKSALAASAAILLGSVSAAHAVPYGFASIQFSNLTLSGLSSTGVSINSSTVTTSSSANYDAAAPDSASAGGDLTTGSDVRQSISGPGPFPAGNTFTPALTAAAGARGDSGIFGAITGGATAGDVAEGRLLVASSTAASTGGTSTGINLTVSVTTPTTFRLTFNATDTLTATTTAAGDGSSAEVNASFSITGGPSGFNGFTYAPGALNTSVSASGVNGNQSTSNPLGAFDTGLITLSAGTYQFSLLSGAQERLQSGAPVPEPVSLALLGSGLVAFGFARARRK